MAHVDKKQMRQVVLDRLKSCKTGAVRKEQSLLLRQALSKQLSDCTRSPLNIAIYAPLAHEVDLIPLLWELPQHRYTIPRCYRQGRMEFYHVQSPELELEQSCMGFAEPIPSCPRVEASDLDYIIVPGVAFTRAGARLGYGGGYYDRYLLRCPQTKAIALCFAEQLVEALAVEPHDLLIPEIISL